MDEIRTEVWDYLYKNGPSSVKTIAEALDQTAKAIQEAAADEWFIRQEDVLAIAVSETGDSESRGEANRSADESSIQVLRSLFRARDTTSDR